jgi:hypothetical protein
VEPGRYGLAPRTRNIDHDPRADTPSERLWGGCL